MLNPMPKWVASTTLTAPIEWNATLIEATWPKLFNGKDEHDRDLISSGCGAFAFLVEHGLVDELMFWVNPTIQGPGDRPFHEGDPSTSNSSAHKASSQRLSSALPAGGPLAPKPLAGASAE